MVTAALRYIPVVLLLFLLGCSGTTADNGAGIAVNSAAPSATPKTGTSSSKETVTLSSDGGIKLVGTLWPASKPASPALLLLHQWQSDRHSYDAFAETMQARGFAVLSFDGRGFGESTSTSDGKDVKPERTDAAVKGMLADVGAAFDFLAKQDNVDQARIGIVGASYGSSLALIYSSNDPRVKAVALLSPGVNYFGNMATVPAIKGYGDRPLLLVAAEDDKASAESVVSLKAASDAASHEVKIYPKGGHGTALLNADLGLQERLEEFFKNL